MVLGWCGGAEIDKQCAHEASTGLQNAQLKVMKHIIEVFIHADEDPDENELKKIAINRAEKHALNTLELLKGKTTLTSYAGHGRRQGREDEGQLK